MPARPKRGEYASYYGRYIDKVPDGPIVDVLERQIVETARLLASIDEAKAAYRYAPGKWSIKQIVGHLSDIERVFQYRALAFARGDAAPLPGVEQDDYVAAANFDVRSLEDLSMEFQAVRKGGIALFRSLSEDAFLRTGEASGFTFTVRAIPYILAGHELHHMSVLRERYL